ncbi:MAG: DUF4367 domain-containing protein [Candidatus Saccharibacteria bacterium]
MKNEKNIDMNSQAYNRAAGLPVDMPTASKKLNDIRNIHSIAQKSQALYNRAIQRPAVNSISKMRRIGRSIDIARSKSIAHFATHRTTDTKPNNQSTINNKRMDIGPVKHPLAARVEQVRSIAKNQTNKPITNKPAKIIKEEAITAALKKPAEKSKKTKNLFKRYPKLVNAFSIGLILLITVGYFAYINMPALSVRIASAQANIEAKYPSYHPDGYSINGPVSYSNGQVVINFHANTGNSQFSIKQTKSSWDSSALEVQVNKDSNGEFITTQDGGLTIYTYNNNAAWINDGILYNITGNAPLSIGQIQKIVTGLL